ncbi:MAG: metallophosphoesterase [Ignavibacteria bacterium]
MNIKFVKLNILITLFFLFFKPVYLYSNLSFLVIGDWGRDGKFNQMEVANQMGLYAQKLNVSFVISTGYNFYPDGVFSIFDNQWQTSFENIYTHISLQIPWYVSLGNHDYLGNVQAEIDYTKTKAIDGICLPDIFLLQSIR